MQGSRKLSDWIVWTVALRCWILQASWNFGRMQNLGYLFAVFPALRRLYRGAELQKVCRRNLAYFNTNPVLAFPVIGACLRLEEKKSQGGDLDMEVEDFKVALAGPCAAMGDSFFWGTLRPLAAVIAVWLACAGYAWSVIVFLLVYNLPAVGLRCYGFLQGYRRGYRIVDDFQRWHLSNLAYNLRSILVVLLGGLSAWLVFGALHGAQVAAPWGLFAVPAVVLGGFLVRRGLSALILLISLVILLWIGWILWSHVRF